MSWLIGNQPVDAKDKPVETVLKLLCPSSNG